MVFSYNMSRFPSKLVLYPKIKKPFWEGILLLNASRIWYWYLKIWEFYAGFLVTKYSTIPQKGKKTRTSKIFAFKTVFHF
jgi:hypothetical protein